MYSGNLEVKRFIEENTEIVRAHLTPEIGLRLFTPACRFWHERPELWPFSDPFWAIYWPGGQALARYILDKPETVRFKRVLDIGSGCGASSIAAGMSGASRVLANDVDPIADIAITMNCELNNMKPFPVLSRNIIGTEPARWDVILLGDMFYEEELADGLHHWLRKCIRIQGTQVLIGDPGRSQFTRHAIQRQLEKMAEYELPDTTKEENYGLSTSTVWEYRP
uniref:Electron transfer flavoprotein beta subunit lysine methyltransferase n=2 Tax=Latimeria chalumnae TaxID=7897 RepID=H3AZ38_LATCH